MHRNSDELSINQDHFSDPGWGAEQLKTIGIFKSFDENELKKVYQLGQITVVKAKAHAVIEGESTRGLYMIFSGSLSVYKNDSANGSMHRIAYMDEGHVFGELSLFDDAPRSATVVADTICHLFHLDAMTFGQFLTEEGHEFSSRFYRTCAQEMAERFRAINADYINSQQLLWKYALRKANDGSEDKAG